jgi:hypothetical protein
MSYSQYSGGDDLPGWVKGVLFALFLAAVYFIYSGLTSTPSPTSESSAGGSAGDSAGGSADELAGSQVSNNEAAIVQPGIWEAWGVCGNGNYYLNRGWTPSTSPKPTSGSANASCIKYEGCYTDLHPNRLLPIEFPDTKTFDQCYTEAKNKNLPYFGMQWWGAGNPSGATKGQCWLPSSSTSTLAAGTSAGIATNCTADGPLLDLDGTGAKKVIVGAGMSNAIYSLVPLP